MASQEDSDTGFFLPLRGHEKNSRLEAKFEHYFDSDDDEDEDEAQDQLKLSKKDSIGRVSQWKPSPQGKWLQSPSKAKKKCAVALGGGVKYISPLNTKRKSKQQLERRGDLEKLDLTEPSTKRGMKVNAKMSSPLKKSRLDIAEYSSEDEDGFKPNPLHMRYKTEGNANESTVKQSPKTSLAPCNTSLSVPLEEKLACVWHEFSEVDPERPRLPVEPVADKIDFLLSEDGAQPRIAVPAPINQYLRDYQREGIHFLYHHYAKGTGAILGDDMGLGKTVQVIGFLSALLGKTGKHTDSLHAVPKFIKQMSNDFPNTPPRKATRPFLIIGPTAVLYNWLDELNTWGYFSVGKFHGSDKDSCFADLKKAKLEIVVTTFETFRDKVEQLNQIEWESVIVDEVHKIKGLKAQVTQALRIIKTPCRFGLTGTALQNNMTELWSLLDWAQPKVLGTLEQFDTIFVKAIETGQRRDATKRELALARKQRDKFASIRRKMLLRRTKKLIAHQLPQKEELVVMCRLTDLQVSVYKAVLDHPDMHLVLQAEDPCNCHSGKQRASCCYKRRADGTKVWGLVFSFMHLMLKAANHVGLLIPDSDAGENHPACLCDEDGGGDDTGLKKKPGADLARSVFKIAFKNQPQFVELTRSAAFRTLSDPRYCGKMKILQGFLRVFEKNHDKVLIFSYSTKLLDIIEQHVISQGYEYSRIDGKVSGQKRRDIVHKFNTDPSLFICLISTKAGGLGLNLTGANKVVIFDPNWNPSHDLQAQDRAYRIGQTRDVKVFRLISAGTIEENIYLRQIYKQQLDEVAIGNINAKRYFHGIQGDKTNQGELFGVKNMFALRTGDVCLTMDILKRNERLEQGLAGFDIAKYVPPKKENGDAADVLNSEDEDYSARRNSCGSEGIDNDLSEREEREEDEKFLRNIFGRDRVKLKSSSSSRLKEQSKLSNQETTFQKTDEDSNDSDDDEFSLIPTRINRQKNHSVTSDHTKSKRVKDSKTASCSRVSEIQNDAESGVAGSGGEKTAFDDLFDMSDITFSTTRASVEFSAVATSRKANGGSCLESTSLPRNVNAKQPMASSKRSGISWLDLEETDHGSGDYDQLPSHHHTEKSKNLTPLSVRQVKLASSTTTTASSSSRKVRVSDTTRSGHQIKQRKKQDKPKISSEMSLLACSDVLHTHTNTGVLGASKAEDHMTRCAIKDVYELHTNTQAPALVCDPLSQEKDDHKKQVNKGPPRPQSSKKTSDATSRSAKSEQDLSEAKYSPKIPMSSKRCAASPSSKSMLQLPASDTSPGKLRNKGSPYKRKHLRSGISKAPTPFFLEANTLASDSQESVTATSPPSPHTAGWDAGDDDATEDYHPISPPPKRRLSPRGKASPLKSQHRTRLRHNKEGVVRTEATDKPPQGKQSTSLANLPQEKETVPAAALRRHKNEPDEDIATLLYELGQPYANDLSKQGNTSKTWKKDIETKGKVNASKGVLPKHDVVLNNDEYKNSRTLHKVSACDQREVKKSSSAKTKSTHARGRAPVSILDDLFGESFLLPSLEKQSTRNDNSRSESCLNGGKDIDHTTTSSAKKRETSLLSSESMKKARNEHHLKSKDVSEGTSITSKENCTSVRNADFSSKSRQSSVKFSAQRPAHNVSSKKSVVTTAVSGASSSAAVVKEDGNESESDMFDIFLTNTSTFREDTRCRKSSGTKGKEQQKRSENKVVKKLFGQDEKMDLDFDDLENCGKFKPARLDDVLLDSESLFS